MYIKILQTALIKFYENSFRDYRDFKTEEKEKYRQTSHS